MQYSYIVCSCKWSSTVLWAVQPGRHGSPPSRTSESFLVPPRPAAPFPPLEPMSEQRLRCKPLAPPPRRNVALCNTVPPSKAPNIHAICYLRRIIFFLQIPSLQFCSLPVRCWHVDWHKRPWKGRESDTSELPSCIQWVTLVWSWLKLGKVICSR